MTTIASMASIPSRTVAMRRVVETIAPQVDRMFVYLNGYREVPKQLASHKNVFVARSQNTSFGDRGDAGKFFWSQREERGFRLTCDDDLEYPSDYVEKMVRACEAYGCTAVVGVHGYLFRHPFVSMQTSRLVFMFDSALDQDRGVHVLGTGTSLYHTDAIRISSEHFTAPNMADILFALAAQKQAVPMVAIRRSKGWVKQGLDPARSIYKSSIRKDATFMDSSSRQTRAIKGQGRWRVHKAEKRKS